MLPIAVLCLGAAVFALGLGMPRAVAVVGALPAVGGFLLQVIADSVGAPGWVGQLSPFAHLAAVPHAPVNWTASAAWWSSRWRWPQRARTGTSAGTWRAEPHDVPA